MNLLGTKNIPLQSSFVLFVYNKTEFEICQHHGILAIGFDDGFFYPNRAEIRDIKRKTGRIVICFPNSTEAEKNAADLAEKYNFPIVFLPKRVKNLDVFFSATDTENPDKVKPKEWLSRKVDEAIDDYNRKLSNTIYIRENQYWKKVETKEGKAFDTSISNFIIRVIALVSSNTNPRRIVELISEHGHTKPFEISVEDFISIGNFRKVTESLGSFLFYGNATDMMEIKKMTFMEADKTSELQQMGWSAEYQCYVLSNGIIEPHKPKEDAQPEATFSKIDEFGIVYTINQTGLFIPAYSCVNIESDQYSEYKNFKHIESETNFQDWGKIFLEVYGKNGLFGLAFGIASLNFDLIHQIKDAFPVMFLFGPPASGKSTMARSLLCMFGVPQKPTQLGSVSTTKGMMRKFAQFKNAIVWLDEYKNSIKPEVIASIKGIFDGQGYSRAQKTESYETTTTPISSSCILSGQELPTIEPALFSRCVLLNFESSRNSIKKLKELKEIETAGISSILIYLIRYRPLIQKHLNQYMERFYTELAEIMIQREKAVNTRLIESYTSIFVPLFILMEKADLKIDFGTLGIHSIADMMPLIAENMERQQMLQVDNSEIKKFWDIVKILVDKNFLEFGKHIGYTVKEKYLWFKPAEVHAAYYEYTWKTYSQKGLDRSSLMEYLSAEKYFIRSNIAHRTNQIPGALPEKVTLVYYPGIGSDVVDRFI